MITIHHLGVSQSDRIVWLMEELAMPYQLVWYDRGADGLAPEEYLNLHPARMAPVVSDGERLMAESVAIVQYIAHRHGGGRLTVAPESPHYWDYLYWLEFNNNAQVGFFVRAGLAGTGQENGLIGRVAARRTEGLFRQMDDHLARRTYLAGDAFTLADLMSGFAVTTMPALGGRTLDDLPNVRRFAERLMQREAWQKAMAIAGPQVRRPG